VEQEANEGRGEGGARCPECARAAELPRISFRRRRGKRGRERDGEGGKEAKGKGRQACLPDTHRHIQRQRERGVR
jgi:hypothetical protein